MGNVLKVAGAALVVMLVSAAAGFASDAGEPATPKTIRIEGGQLQKSATNDELAFTVTIDTAGEWEVALDVGGRTAEGWTLNLVMEPEAGGAARQAVFSYDGKYCG
jgi:hypothetical protein